MKLLGYILRIGNILNGGSNKGQADGFDLAVIGKCHTFRDNNGQSVLHYVCKKMKDKDPEFPELMKSVNKKMQIRYTDLDTLKAISTELTTKINQAVSNYSEVKNSREPEDKFTKFMESAVKNGETEANDFAKKKEEIFLYHDRTCELFGLDPKDEQCSKSPIFLKCFQDFFKAVVECLPPEEKKRGAAARPKAAQAAKTAIANAEGGGMMAHMEAMKGATLKKAKKRE